MNEYPTASLTADCVVITERYGLSAVLVIERGSEPFKDMLALPGGFVNAANDEQGELPIEAAYRELEEETSLDKNLLIRFSSSGGLAPCGVYAKPGRDPRGRVVSFAFTVLLEGLEEAESDAMITVGDDAAAYVWADLNSTLRGRIPLAFDHRAILRGAAEHWRRVGKL